ncbi:MAG TPA: 1,4-dihydroxy-6-naphthoate synthase [Nitriliruptorales bacterium]
MTTIARELTLGYSPCPNDTFIFHALTHGRIALPGFTVREVLDDVETLNRWATQTRLDLTKISYHAYAHLRDDYVALRAGGALGEGVGPLLVARDPDLDLTAATIGIPGRLTTANLLLQLVVPHAVKTVERRYEQLMPAVAGGDLDAALIIHESRFTYAEHGLVAVLDVGQAWEQRTGLPLPLGAILVRRDLGPQVAADVNAALRASLEHAYAHPDESVAYIREHAQELDEAVVRQHIDLYVNRYSLDVGERGEAAVRELFRQAQARGLAPSSDRPLFAP